jgi:hypothetical protein
MPQTSALIVEDGTNVAGADAFDTLDNCVLFASQYYGSSLPGSVDSKDAAARRAAAYLNGLNWKGVRQFGRAQSMAWPRTDASDGEGNQIPEDTVPDEVKRAQHVFARAELLSPGILTPQVVVNEAIKSEQVGPLRTEFFEASRNVEQFRPILTQAQDLIAGLLKPKASSRFLLRA